MTKTTVNIWAEKSLAGEPLTHEECMACLKSDEIELLPLLHAAFQVRKAYWKNEVTIHIINNVQNGNCPETCSYCAQAKTSEAGIADYAIKPESEIIAEAKRAYDQGAYRYCMVLSGRGPAPRRVDKLAELISKIKQTVPIEVCLSSGLLNEESTKKLKAAGLDRLNHNLNTSESFYPEICDSHTFQDRMKTLLAGQAAGLGLCSGMIVGLGEKQEDIIDVAFKLRELGTVSIPVNFLIPIEGTTLKTAGTLTPDYCLRVLSLFRFLNPKAEIRIAAGREVNLRSMQVLALYPANSLFMQGYLNTTGTEKDPTLQMIKDAGFDIRSDHGIDALLDQNNETKTDTYEVKMKTLADLRPELQV